MVNFKEFVDRYNERLLITSGYFAPEYIRDKPVCMNQFTNIIGMTRIPGEKADTLNIEKPSTAKHIIVLCRNQIYKMDVIHKDAARADLEDLERLLLEIGRDSLSSDRQLPIGLLTAGHRDNWFEAYQKISKTNKDNLETINSALFAVCLDDHSTKRNINESHQQFFHNKNAHNRWFDKCIQIIVCSSGRAGVNGEVFSSEFSIVHVML
jgi:carnitine O-acetyltransferase